MLFTCFVKRSKTAVTTLAPSSWRSPGRDGGPIEPDNEQQLEDLRALGKGFEVNDFCACYSSLSSLREMPIQRLKIGGSLIAGLPTNDNSIGSSVLWPRCRTGSARSSNGRYQARSQQNTPLASAALASSACSAG